MYGLPFRNRFPRKKAARYRPGVRPDAEIQAEIWQRLLQLSSLGVTYQDQITVEVENGWVYLNGHVTKEQYCMRAQEAPNQVSGVTGITNNLLLDDEIRNDVLSALIHDERTTPYCFRARCSYGWIHLSGIVPNAEVAKAAEEAAAQVPTVRGVIGMPSIIGIALTGMDMDVIRRALQPRLGAVVFEEKGEQGSVEIGTVTQIILDPGNRLVSHIAVWTHERGAGKQSIVSRIIPTRSTEAVSQRYVWLREGEKLSQYPVFYPGQYPLAPRSWMPPFPYKAGTVRWSWNKF